MMREDLIGSRWRGTAELWLDPAGNTAQTSGCTLEVRPDALSYAWEYEGAPHHGTVALDEGGGIFTDSWHSPSPMRCVTFGTSSALFDLLGSYGGADGPPWGWRLILSVRPGFGGAAESLVLQMANVAPWGEEARAVRMVASRA